MSPDPLIQLCIFRVGGQDYAIDGRRVEELIGPLPLTRMVSWRGVLVRVASLRALLAPEAGRVQSAGPLPVRYLLTRVGRRRVALAVDEVHRVVRVPSSAVQRERPAPFVVGTLDDVHLLDVLALLRARGEAGA